MSVPALNSTRTLDELPPEVALMRSVLPSMARDCSRGMVISRSISSGEADGYGTRTRTEEEVMVG